MDRETEKYYEDLMTTFATPGWKTISSTWTNALGDLATNTLKKAKSVEDLWFAKGEANKLEQMTRFEDAMKAAFDRLRNESDT